MIMIDHSRFLGEADPAGNAFSWIRVCIHGQISDVLVVVRVCRRSSSDPSSPLNGARMILGSFVSRFSCQLSFVHYPLEGTCCVHECAVHSKMSVVVVLLFVGVEKDSQCGIRTHALSDQCLKLAP